MIITMVATIYAVFIFILCYWLGNVLKQKWHKFAVLENFLWTPSPVCHLFQADKSILLFFVCYFRLAIPFCRPTPGSLTLPTVLPPKICQNGKRKIESYSHTNGDIIFWIIFFTGMGGLCSCQTVITGAVTCDDEVLCSVETVARGYHLTWV